ADDALIMGEWSRSNAMNLSRILTCFHLASGLKVNFNKSKLYGVGVSNVELNSLASTVGCIAAQFPCTYLGLPIGASMSRCHHWTLLVDRFHKRLSTWKSKSLSIGGRLTLNKSVLGSLGVYYFSTYKAPKKIINKLESIRRNFFWGGSMDDNKIPWIAWEKVLSPRDHGGLGIGGLRTCNQAMLAKWRWRSNFGVWHQIVKLRNDLLKVNINLPSIFKIKLGNGQSTSFWHDPWIGGSPLEDSFPRLYRLDTNPNCNVFDRKPTDIVHVSSNHLVSFGPEDTTSPPGLLFQWAWRREPRTTPELEELANLVSLLSQLHLTISEDTWECSIDDSRCFTVKGMRSYITSMSPPASYVATRWNRIVPLKVNINTWRVMNGRMATRSNLDRRGVDLDSVRCPLCDDGIETEDHIFVHCKVAKELWSDVLKWWRIPNVSFPFLQDLVHLADHTPLGEKFTKFFDVVVQTTIWSIWRYRNNVIFSAKKPSKDLIFNDIKMYSFNWIVSRGRKVSLNRIMWFDHPCNALSPFCTVI
ncbi:putative RNA-directed DNA polymerase, partial [Tanacetum coccineum]